MAAAPQRRGIPAHPLPRPGRRRDLVRPLLHHHRRVSPHLRRRMQPGLTRRGAEGDVTATKRWAAGFLVAAALALAITGTAAAQDWPKRPITIVVPFDV